jgi:hypothetical protein
VRSDRASNEIIGIFRTRRPLAQRLVGGIFERLGTGIDATYRRTQESHRAHVRRLALYVANAHKDLDRQSKSCTDGRGGDAVLTRARFGDDARFTKPARQQSLTNGIVDFVRAGVIAIFALENDRRAVFTESARFQ